MKRRSFPRTMFLSGVLACGVGCGGGGGGQVTRADSTGFSEDAYVLASRVATGPELPAELVAPFEEDLKQIRAKFPRVQDIHLPLPDAVLKDVPLGLKLTAPWLEAWKSGTLTTGDAAVDALLTRHHVTEVRFQWAYSDHAWFMLKTGQPLNTRAFSALLKDSSPQFLYVESNGIVGDGSRITFEQAENARRYTFSVGWGDCPSGCIYRHSWEFTLVGGDIQLREFGAPLNPDGSIPREGGGGI